MLRYAPPLQKLIGELERLPGIGPKTAQRLAFFLLDSDDEQVEQLGQAVLNLKAQITRCRQCHNYAEAEVCPICEDPGRGQTAICVVERASDLMALERSGEHNGLYHVLGGALSPVADVTPSDLFISHLIERIGQLQPEEVIIATSPTVEGDATAEYIRDLISRLESPPRVTRIALGLPVGGDLDYADQVTLARSLRGRATMEG